MTTILELIQARLEKGNILPPLKEAWKEYSILALMIGGGLGVGVSAVALVGIGAKIAAGLVGGAMLGYGSVWAIHETIKS